MTAELKDLSQQQQSAFHEFRRYLDQELGVIRTEMTTIKDHPDLTAETKATLERIQEKMTAHEKRMNELQIALNAPKSGGFDTPEMRDEQKSRAAFNKALRYGPKALNSDERKFVKFDADEGIQTKAMYQADGTTGGFLTVPEYVGDLLKEIVLLSPMRAICDVRETTNPYIVIPKRTQTASAYRIAEQATRTESQNPRFGQVNVFPYESAALCLVSRTDLDDVSLDLGGFIMSEFAEQFAKLEGNEIINGDGAGKCVGFLSDPDVTATANITTTATVNVVQHKDLVKVMRSIKPGYLDANARWVMTNESVGVLQSLTDTNGNPLWSPFGGTVPSKLYGYDYVVAPDMPQIASTKFAIAFGNFKRGYQVVIRKQVSIQVLQERYADQNLVGYLGYYRFGGSVKMAEAIKLLKIQ